MFTLGTAFQAGSTAFPGQVPQILQEPNTLCCHGSPAAYLSIVFLSLPLRLTMGAKLL